MATNIDINLDRSGGLLSGGSCPFGALPKFTRNDQYLVRLRVLERNTSGAYTDAVLSSPSFKMGIGSLGDVPTSGEFKLTIGATTSSAISYNATTTQVLNAISGIAGNALIEVYGNSGSGWLVTAATANTALSFGGASYTLFPTSSVLINTRRNPGTDIKAQQVIELTRNPAVFSDTFTAVSGDVLALNKIQDGSSTQNEVYELTVGNDVLGGSFSLSYGGYSISSDVFASAISIGTQLNAITGISSGNLDVRSNSKRGFVFTFVNELGLQNITTALILDPTGIVSPNYYQSTLTMGTVQLDELFVEADSDTITPTIAFSMSESGKVKTLYQGAVTVDRDLIASGSAVPAPTSQYYTKTETDSGFVANSSSNVNSTGRSLNDSSAIVSLNYGSRTLNNNSGTQVVSYGTGIAFANTPMGFFGSSVTAKPSGTNIVSGLTNLGLLSYTTPTAVNVISSLNQTGLLTNNNTNTFGVFPLSSRTLTTTASLNFGSVGSNSSTSITVAVTGAIINDIVLIGLPTAICEGLSFLGHAVGTDQVHIDAINATNSAKNQATATYRITVIGY
jgi:hypothetical protein